MTGAETTADPDATAGSGTTVDSSTSFDVTTSSTTEAASSSSTTGVDPIDIGPVCLDGCVVGVECGSPGVTVEGCEDLCMGLDPCGSEGLEGDACDACLAAVSAFYMCRAGLECFEVPNNACAGDFADIAALCFGVNPGCVAMGPYPSLDHTSACYNEITCDGAHTTMECEGVECQCAVDGRLTNACPWDGMCGGGDAAQMLMDCCGA